MGKIKRRSFVNMDICVGGNVKFSGFKGVFLPKKNELHYIGGAEVLPAPLTAQEEGA